MDVVKSPYDARDYKIKPEVEFPSSFSLTTVSVKNQGTKPTCTAHALASVVEYHYQKQHNDHKEFSTEFIYGIREKGYYIGDGMVIRDGLKTLSKYGDVLREDCWGNHNYKDAMERVQANFEELQELAFPHRISAYFRINSTEELKTALMKYGVVVVSMDMYKGETLKNDVYTYPTKAKKRGAHCVFIYGWDERGWLVQNSWGKLYGWDGRFVIPFDFKFIEMWGIADDIVEGEIVKPKRNKWFDAIYEIVNKIVNLFSKNNTNP